MCNRDCFNCVYEDCIMDDISSLEKQKQDKADSDIIYGRKTGRQLQIARYERSEKGKARKRRYVQKLIDSGKNAEILRNRYRRRREAAGMQVKNSKKMECVFCGKTNVRVIGSVVDGKRIVRERRCDDCRGKFYTEEVADVSLLCDLRYQYNKLRDSRYKFC